MTSPQGTVLQLFLAPEAHTLWCLWPSKSHQFSFGPL